MIQCIISDVDGVMTDGSITYDENGNQLKTFHARDGLAIKAWMTAGYKFAIVTARGGVAVERRAKELGVEALVTHSKNKAEDSQRILSEFQIDPAEAAFVGDDLPDAPAMRLLGHSYAPADAAFDIQNLAQHVTTSLGGRGVLREIIEELLRKREQWPAV